MPTPNDSSIHCGECHWFHDLSGECMFGGGWGCKCEPSDLFHREEWVTDEYQKEYERICREARRRK